MPYTVAVFGEAERGELAALHPITSLAHLNEAMGTPPMGTEGIFFAVQFLLFEYAVIFIRVSEEGFGLETYFKGLHLLEKKGHIPKMTALCLPGVGDSTILEACHPLCERHSALIVSTEKDLFDYLTSRKFPTM